MLQRNARVTPAELVDEGRITVEQGHTIAYRVYGTGTRTLVGLHGGPGPSSAYIARLNEVLGDDMMRAAARPMPLDAPVIRTTDNAT